MEMKAQHITRRRLVALALAGAVAGFATASKGAAEISLKTGTSWNDKFPMKVMLKDVLKPKMEQYSNGRLTMDIHMAKSL
jgi:TRAP-type C4-dicarboxylate transport system substrate-binding protein